MTRVERLAKAARDADDSPRRVRTPYQLEKARRKAESKIEGKLRAAFEARLEAQRDAVLALLRRKGLREEPAEKSAVMRALGALAKVEIDDKPKRVKVSDAEIREAITKPLTREIEAALRAGVEDGGAVMADSLGISWREADPEVISFLEQHALDLVDDLDDVTVDKIQGALSTGYEAGEGNAALIERVYDSGAFSAGRAGNIARTESHTAVSSGNYLAMQQAGERTHTWYAAPNARPTHQEASGQSVKVGEPFEVGDAELLYPGDPVGGAGYPEEVINCFLPGTRVEGRFVAGLKAFYSGPAREIETSRGERLRVTPNHPILTDHGWRPASALRKGDHLLACRLDIERSMLLDVDDQDGPLPIEQVFDSLAADRGVSLEMVCALDLHGDARHVYGDVDIVRPFGTLRDDREACGEEGGGDLALVPSDPVRESLMGDGTQMHAFGRINTSRSRLPRGGALALDGGTVQLETRPLNPLCVGLAARFDSSFAKDADDCGSSGFEFVRKMLHRFPGLKASDNFLRLLRAESARMKLPGFVESAELHPGSLEMRSQRTLGNTVGSGDGKDGLSGEVSLDEIVELRDFAYTGHVYDLQTETGWLIAEHCTSSNCRCTALADPLDETAPSDLAEGLDVDGDDALADKVREVAEDLDPQEIARVDPVDIDPLTVSAGAKTEYDPETGELTLAPRAKAKDIQDALREHMVSSLLTPADARAFENQLENYDLPKPKVKGSELKRATTALRAIVTRDWDLAGELFGTEITPDLRGALKVLAENFWTGGGVKGSTVEKR